MVIELGARSWQRLHSVTCTVVHKMARLDCSAPGELLIPQPRPHSPRSFTIWRLNMTSTPGGTASNTLLLRRQLAELTKHPIEGISAGTFARYGTSIDYAMADATYLRQGLLTKAICSSGRL
jgi:hypothetical protein